MTFERRPEYVDLYNVLARRPAEPVWFNEINDMYSQELDDATEYRVDDYQEQAV